MIGLVRYFAVKSCRHAAMVHTVVMIRHGESLWNLEKKFTGWCDVPLTPAGEADAKDAGHLIGQRGLKFDVAFTSNLERAWRTCAMVLATSQQASVETFRSWRLNERHYGALQGHSKDSQRLLEVFGEQRIVDLRRSYDVAPPSLYDLDFLKLLGPEALDLCTNAMHPGYVDQAAYRRTKHMLQHPNRPIPAALPEGNAELHSFPTTESLKQCQERAYGYWEHVIAPRVRAGERVLIVAHANTIRGLVKVIDHIDDDMIAHLKIPNGVPLVYTLDKDLQPTDLTDDIGFQANYLVSARNHGKTMSYERSVKKKLRSLFQFLDHDGDGRITSAELLRGLDNINSWKDGGSISEPDGVKATGEYEVEELIRCVPNADEQGGITLQAFLDSEETVLPTLSKLRLLQ